MKAKALWLVLLTTFLFLYAARVMMSQTADAHRTADTVLLPRFVSEFNEWLNQHPNVKPGREAEHYAKLDAGDVQRWAKVRKAFKELDSAYKRAGY